MLHVNATSHVNIVKPIINSREVHFTIPGSNSLGTCPDPNPDINMTSCQGKPYTKNQGMPRQDKSSCFVVSFVYKNED